MFSFKKKALALSLVLSSGIAFSASAANGCVTCGGYFYTAVMQVNTNGIISQQFKSVGPFASEEECNQAWDVDLGNNDSWLPYFGSPRCAFRFESDYDAFDEIIDSWNLASPSGNDGNIMANEEAVKEISDLMVQYKIKEYKHKLNSVITDPELENDSPSER